MTLHFLNDIANDAESTQKSKIKLSSLPGSDLRTHVESLNKTRDVNKHFESLAW